MKFFYSPAQLFSLIIRRKEYIGKTAKRSTVWYLSQAGCEEFKRADTLARKTLFIYDYLTLAQLSNAKEKKGFLEELLSSRKKQASKEQNEDYKMAFFLAEGIQSNLLDFTDYFEILDVNRNPFLNAYMKLGRFDTVSFLAILNRGSATNIQPYERITYCDKNNISERYRLERLIIAIGEEKSGKLATPFLHNFNSVEVN